MSKFIIIILSLSLVCSVSADTVYKKVNPDGSIEFTDRDSKGSKEIKVRDPVTYPAPELPSAGLPVKKLSPKSDLYSLQIISPTNDSTVTDSPDVTVSITISPGLSAGHKILYQLGSMTQTSEQTSVTFNNVERGSHTIKVSVVNEAADVISSAASSVLHMKRFFKKPAVKPKVP